MSRRRSLPVLIAAATLLAATGTPADASARDLVASWELNEPPGARRMIDSSGHRRTGTIGRDIDTGVAVAGAVGYRFPRVEPDVAPARPQHLATVPDSSALDPGSRDYAVTVRLRTVKHFGNIVQKGQATVSGGSFKLQIPKGIAQCMFRGSAGSLLVSAPRAINDGRWHTVRCERTSRQVALTVDGTLVARRSGRTGTIANTWPVSIGGKSRCDQIEVGCDYYAGDLDHVRIEAG